ncbi:MAG: prepilin peptidase [Chloroflexota bacterium]|nr:prepilin peptidase [Chloroflexota bacterium]
MTGLLLTGLAGALLGWLAGHLAFVIPRGEWRSPDPATVVASRQLEHKLGVLLGVSASGTAYVNRTSLAEWLVTLLLVMVLISLLLIDLQHHLVYPLMAGVGFLAALALNPLARDVTFLSSLVGGLVAALGFLLLFLLGLVLFRVQALGFGDVLLALMIGAMVGFGRMPGTLLLGSLLGAAASLVLLVFRRKGRHDYIPFGSGMCLAAILVLVLTP